MKKTGILAALVIALSSLPVFSLEQGLVLGGGVDATLVGVFPYESVSYKITADNGIGVDLGCRIVENFIGNTNIFFNPTINFVTNKFYLGTGYIFYPGMTSLENLFTLRTGYTFGGWEWGQGIGNMNIGAEYSPIFTIMDADDDDESGLGAALGSVFMTLFSLIKIEVGVSWTLPF